MRLFLAEQGLPTTRRRIQALTLGRHRVEIGGDTPDDGPVLVILEAECVDLFYVCTPERGMLRGPLYPLGLNPPDGPVDFDEEASGDGLRGGLLRAIRGYPDRSARIPEADVSLALAVTNSSCCQVR